MTTRSADECEMSRSCQSGTFSKPTTAAARTTRASPEMRSATFGLRLCGIADEPFMPARERLLDLAHLGAREVADLGREAVERRRADARARRAARRAGRARSPASRPGRARGRAARRRSARPPGRSRRRCRPCRRTGRRGTSRARARGASRARSSSNAQPASFQPNVVGSAWMPCERPMQIVRAVLLGAAHDGGERAVDARRRSARRRRGSAARARCRARRRTSGRSAPSGPPAPSCSATASTNAARSWSVVRSISATRSADGTTARARIAATSSAGIDAQLGPAVERRQLDLEPACELALLRPDPGHLRSGVAGDHSGTV